MDILDCIAGRRSVRSYLPDPVSDDTLAEIVDVARLAPSWANTQCMRYLVVRDPAARFENLTACHLLKWCHHVEDTQGRDMELRYFRDIDRREVDFVLMEAQQPIHFIECKTSPRKSANRALRYLKERFPGVLATQLCLEDGVDDTDKHDIRFQSAGRFLATLA